MRGQRAGPDEAHVFATRDPARRVYDNAVRFQIALATYYGVAGDGLDDAIRGS